MQRFLCSHLVALSWSGGERIVNLEEIWTAGALVECEEPVPVGTLAEIRAGTVFFAGRVTRAEHHEFGWRVEMEFSPLTPWSEDLFRPAHLVGL